MTTNVNTQNEMSNSMWRNKQRVLATLITATYETTRHSIYLTSESVISMLLLYSSVLCIEHENPCATRVAGECELDIFSYIKLQCLWIVVYGVEWERLMKISVGICCDLHTTLNACVFNRYSKQIWRCENSSSEARHQPTHDSAKWLRALHSLW